MTDTTRVEPGPGPYDDRVVFDIETDGLLRDLTKVHLLTIKLPAESTVAFRRNSEMDNIEEGLRALMAYASRGGLVVGHNIINFDIPAIKKVYPWFDLPQRQVFDTLVFSRLRHADFSDIDPKLIKAGLLPKSLYGSHKLEAWGHRLGTLKGEYTGDTRIADEAERKARKWAEWNPDMEAYGIQDCEVTDSLFRYLDPQSYSQRAIELEHKVRYIVSRQERYGVQFDVEKAAQLYAALAARREELHRKLRETVPGAYWPDGKVFTPARDNKARGYVAGAAIQKIRWEDYNPDSSRHTVRYFKTRYGWEPDSFTETGDPKLDAEVMTGLNYPEAPLLAEYDLVQKRIGQLAEGQQAWLKQVRADGRIYGSVNTNGAVTGRMTHSSPNLAQVPKVGTMHGKECRELFGPPPGMVQVGCDASSLELRDLAHYVARWDGGAYAKAVVEGTEEDGTDVHSLNTKALGMEPQKVYVILGRSMKGRNCGKTFIYAWLYGAGDAKIGRIVGQSQSHGKRLKESFLRKSPALKQLKDAVAHACKTYGHLLGLDGRILHVRSAHAALNTLLQSAGAVVMKQALVILDEDLQSRGFVPGVDYEFMLNVHDEFQLAALQEIAHEIGKAAQSAIRRAGEHFNFRCPLDGQYKVGQNWADTH